LDNRCKFIPSEEVDTKDLGEGRIRAIVSTESKDRDGDVIKQAGWDLRDFMKHPVFIASHEYRSLTNIIGQWDKMEVKGQRLIGEATYFLEGPGNEQAQWAYHLAQLGRAAFSVGFIPDMSKAERVGDQDSWPMNYIFNGQKLLEVSQVSIPSNADCVQIMRMVKDVDEDALASGRTFEAIWRKIEALEEDMETLLVPYPKDHDDQIIPIDYAALFKEVWPIQTEGRCKDA